VTRYDTSLMIEKDKDFSESGVPTIPKREINDPEFTAERNQGLRSVPNEWIETSAFLWNDEHKRL